MQQFPQYDINIFIEEACKMTLLDLYALCDKILRNLEDRKVSRKPEDRDGEYRKSEYKRFVHGIAAMLHNSTINPFDTHNDYFQKSKRIIESLVKSGDLDARSLDIFNKV